MIAVDLNRRRVWIDDRDDYDALCLLWKRNPACAATPFPLDQAAMQGINSGNTADQLTVVAKLGWKVEAGDELILDSMF